MGLPTDNSNLSINSSNSVIITLTLRQKRRIIQILNNFLIKKIHTP